VQGRDYEVQASTLFDPAAAGLTSLSL
jgi:hypothetical protein